MGIRCNQCGEESCVILPPKELALLIQRKEHERETQSSLVADATALFVLLKTIGEAIKIAKEIMRDDSVRALYCTKCGHLEKSPI